MLFWGGGAGRGEVEDAIPEGPKPKGPNYEAEGRERG